MTYWRQHEKPRLLNLWGGSRRRRRRRERGKGHRKVLRVQFPSRQTDALLERSSKGRAREEGRGARPGQNIGIGRGKIEGEKGRGRG